MSTTCGPASCGVRTPPKGTTYELDTCAHQDDDQGGRYALLFIKGTDTEKEWL